MKENGDVQLIGYEASFIHRGYYCTNTGLGKNQEIAAVTNQARYISP